MKPFEITSVHPRLYLSNKVWVDRDLPLLCARGIGAVVNLVEDHDYQLPASIAYLHAPFVDGTYIDPAVLHAIYTFVARHLLHTRVLVHCAAGISRSAGIVLGQLLIDNPHWTWEKALRVVERRRAVWVAMEVRESVLGYLAERAARQYSQLPASGSIGREDRELLRRLERVLGIELPQIPAINWNSRGYRAAHDRIVGLGLFDAGLAEFPLPVTQLSGLLEIKMYRNRLRSLPDDIDRLSRLRLLGLFANEISSLPDSIGRLHSLRILNIAGNRLTALPSTVGGLVRLRELYVPSNCLETVPASVGNLRRLRHLYLQKNRLTGLVDTLADLGNLACFSAESNMIAAVPDLFCRSTSLRSLNLSGNQIQTMPPGPWQMPKLENLNISRNALTSLPEGLASLESIRRLNIAWNQLTSLPDRIRNWMMELQARGCSIIAGDLSEESRA